MAYIRDYPLGMNLCYFARGLHEAAELKTTYFERVDGERVSNKFFGMRDFPYLRLGIRDFQAKSGRDSGLKVCAGGRMPKVTLGITGLPETLGRNYGIENLYLGPSGEE